MGAPKRTEGPWFVKGDGVHSISGQVFGPPSWGPYPSEGDLALGAAAPELYEALDRLLTRYLRLVNSGDCGFWDPEKEDEVKAAHAVLLKARGEEVEP